MELMPEAKFTLPSYLQGRNTFVLHVNITPVNDPPVLNLMPGKVLRLTQVCVVLLDWVHAYPETTNQII